jgi:hypothetical protein
MMIPVEGVLVIVLVCCLATGMTVRQWTKNQAGKGFRHLIQSNANTMVGICYGICDEAKAHGLPPQDFLDGCVQQAKKYGVFLKKMEPNNGGNTNGEHTPDTNHS